VIRIKEGAIRGDARVSGKDIGVSILGKVNQAKTKAATVGGTVAARRGIWVEN